MSVVVASARVTVIAESCSRLLQKLDFLGFKHVLFFRSLTEKHRVAPNACLSPVHKFDNGFRNKISDNCRLSIFIISPLQSFYSTTRIPRRNFTRAFRMLSRDLNPRVTHSLIYHIFAFKQPGFFPLAREPRLNVAWKFRGSARFGNFHHGHVGKLLFHGYDAP